MINKKKMEETQDVLFQFKDASEKLKINKKKITNLDVEFK